MKSATGNRALTERFRAAEPQAAEDAFGLYAERLRQLARQHLHRRIRQKVDADDVVQSAYRSFFTRAKRGDWELAGWHDVWGLLVTITLRKCANRAAHYLAARRDVRREVALPVLDSRSECSADACVSDGPTPEEVVMLAESVQQLLTHVGPRDRDIVTCHLQGYTVVEISRELGRAERTVRRVLARVRAYLAELSVSPDSSTHGPT